MLHSAMKSDERRQAAGDGVVELIAESPGRGGESDGLKKADADFHGMLVFKNALAECC
jgi:hypothetical protein